MDFLLNSVTYTLRSLDNSRAVHWKQQHLRSQLRPRLNLSIAWSDRTWASQSIYVFLPSVSPKFRNVLKTAFLLLHLALAFPHSEFRLMFNLSQPIKPKSCPPFDPHPRFQEVLHSEGSIEFEPKAIFAMERCIRVSLLSFSFLG